ncbi:Polyphosphate:AMP phosphotransferase (PAP) (Polyphosphate kinase PPK2 3) [Durusdinium trenchii]|uniref:Polyphosphate:AMP phosphotransferase (PAP) (Polyphosphate kinase PPK2 3) n=1 Tax=Durusdinium trenchii TaxID=1381693 RepID=A0ABP0RGJ7_9DINO
MFEAAEIGHKLSKSKFEKSEQGLRTSLIEMQHKIRLAGVPVIVVVAGDDRPGCDDLINRLNAWLDPRFLVTNAYAPPNEFDGLRPRFWRYWRELPPRGQIGIFAGAWSIRAMADRLKEKLSEADFLRQIGHTRRFEQALAADGAVVIKFWLHVPEKVLLERLEEAEKHPDREWRVQPEDWAMYEKFEQAQGIVETFIRQTSTATAPWHIVESSDWKYRDVKVSELLLEAVNRQLQLVEQDSANEEPDESSDEMAIHEDNLTILDRVDLSLELSRDDYEQKLEQQQARLSALAREAHQQGLSTVLAFEGWDAAGKGGTIRRLVASMNAHLYRVVSISKPSQDELAHHYLWRFWRSIPRPGHFQVFDRSWYGRVLVERVEGFASEPEWRRAYAEINNFEEQLHEHGIVLAKFWLHISKDEQLKRFEARKNTPYKRFKITDEDYRNREKWDQYEEAASEMVARTSTSYAPWHLVAANDKRWARVYVIKTVCDALEATL